MKLAWLRALLFACLLTAGFASAQEMHKMEGMLAPAPATVPEEPVSFGLAELETLALERNPTLAQAAAYVAASRGKALQAGLWLNPDVGYIGELMGTEGTAGEFQGGYIQQTIVTGGKLRLSRAKYNQEAFEAEILATAQQLRVLNGVRLRYYEVMALQRMLEVRKELLANAREHLRTRKEQFNTGQTTRTGVLQAEVEANRADINVRMLENRNRAAWQQLIAVVNAPELTPGSLAGNLEPDGPALDFDCSLEILLRDSPQLQAAHAHAVHDQIMVQRERRQPIPNVTVQAATGQNFETNNTVASVQVGINLPVFDRNQGTIRQAQADLSRSLAEIQRVELLLRASLAETFSHYLTAYQTVQIYRESSLPRLEEAYKIQQDMYKARRLPWIEVVATQKELLLLRTEYTQALLDLRHAEVAIRGLLLVDGLTQPPPPLPGGHIDAVPKPR